MDASGNVLNWNVGAERVKGYKKNEIVGKNFSLFYTAGDLALGVPKATLDSAFRYSVFETEGWRVRKDGSQFWANIVVHSRLDASKKLIGFVKVTRDATERRTMERLREGLNQAQKMESVGQLVGGACPRFQ